MHNKEVLTLSRLMAGEGDRRDSVSGGLRENRCKISVSMEYFL